MNKWNCSKTMIQITKENDFIDKIIDDFIILVDSYVLTVCYSYVPCNNQVPKSYLILPIDIHSVLIDYTSIPVWQMGS